MRVIINAKTKRFKQKKTCSFISEQQKILFKEKQKSDKEEDGGKWNPAEKLHP